MRLAPLEESLDADLYGGKAAQLASAVGAGLPVPRGVALSVELVRAIAAGSPAAIAGFERAWPLLQAPLAVRSSAVGEDSDEASFAGQHLTCLNLRSAMDGIDAVEAIWRSAHSDSALAYRRRLGLTGTPRMAVVLQELVDADCAGVLFTRNPLDGADELVVEAAWASAKRSWPGSSRRIASVWPETARCSSGWPARRISPSGLRPREVRKRSRSRANAFERSASTTASSRRSLTREALRRVFSGARDLEWAFAGETLHLLQCRRVTSAASLTR